MFSLSRVVCNHHIRKPYYIKLIHNSGGDMVESRHGPYTRKDCEDNVIRCMADSHTFGVAIVKQKVVEDLIIMRPQDRVKEVLNRLDKE